MNEPKRIAEERRDLAEHTHLNGAEHRGSNDHLTGQQTSRHKPEHSTTAYLQAQWENRISWMEYGVSEVSRELREEDIAAFAYELWQLRGCPEGSPQEDWYRAVTALNSRTQTH